ncbi:hypothetical protein PTTG_30091 [Puccinia triticina 1-1 BBBD Race 1]|uniref:Uncharacterized protein n=1 Tax=Puccinia triticina (isolate 1-1 / race 1 (BBBD)) TaxID=630390 RepID=A0A180G0V5_PUCT1|nr:hypothetical protein PTTG_30091 [Puccinia triticina 1-1 BBBD Race 1]
MIYLLGNKLGVEDTNEEMSEDQGSILMDIDANHRPPPGVQRHSGRTRCAKDAISP